MDISGKKDCCKQIFNNIVVICGRREMFYSSMSRSDSFSETVPLDCGLHMRFCFFPHLWWDRMARVGWHISPPTHGRPEHLELGISLLSGQLGSS